MSAPFPQISFWNINHLGTSKNHRRDAKLENALQLCRHSDIVCFQEVRSSPGVAESAFFSHLPGRLHFYTSHGPGLAFSVSTKFAHEDCIAPDTEESLSPNHLAIDQGDFAHALHWYQQGVHKLLINPNASQLPPPCFQMMVGEWVQTGREGVPKQCPSDKNRGLKE